MNGGTRVDAGRDEDGDGVLSDAEVEQTIFVCAPTPQPPNPVLVRRDPAPSGACAGAGTTVSAGIDADGDGVLSDAEVTQTTTVCSETIFTFTVRNAADLELLSRATRVAGSLVVSGSDLESAYIPVQVVDGSIAVESNPKLASITLMPQLVGGGIAVRHNPLLTFVALGGVLGKPKQLSGSLELVDDPVLTTVAGLDALSVVGGNLVLDGTGMPLVPELDVLAYVGGNVVIANNPALLWWPPSPLIDVRGYVLLQANPSFAQYPDSLPFSSIAGMLTVADDGLGSILKLGEVRYVAGITVSNNARLVDVEFPFLASIDGDLTIVDNDVLDLGYGINHVRSIAGSVLVARNANLTTFGTLFDLTTVSADVVMTDNPKLQYLWTDDLASARDVVIARNAALTTLGGFGTTANLAGLAHVESLDVEANPVLAHLVIPGLTYASLLTVKDNTLLSTCDALALAAQVTAPPGHTVVITGNAGDGSGCP